MNKREIACTACKAVNRVAAYSISRKPKCGRCGVELPETAPTRIVRSFYRFRVLAPLGVILAPLGVIGLVTLSLLTTLRLIDGPGKAERLANFSCPTVANPTNGLLTNWTSKEPRPSNISVHADPGMNYVLKAEDADTHLPIVMFFVNGGSTFKTNMRAGRIVFKIASGLNWCGPKEMFGPDTMTACLAQKGETDGKCSVYTFSQGDTWEIDLVRQVGGNLTTPHVSRDEF